MKPPKKEVQKPVAKLPTQPIGKELRDSFERVRDEPIPEKLKELIAELKKKENDRKPR